MKRSVWGSPALPMALRNMDNPRVAKMPPRINQSHTAVLGVRRAMICPLAREYSARSASRCQSVVRAKIIC